MPGEPLTIVGGGLAAGSAVRTLRRQAYDGDVVVIAAEPHHPYERPPLTKEYLRGESDRTALFTPVLDWYRENEADVHVGVSAVAIEPDAHQITLADGRSVTYSKLLLATGSSPRPLSVTGADLRGVLLLRSIRDAELLAASLTDAHRDGAGRLVVIGDGWIGMEVAASARSLGLDVTVVGRGDVPLARVLGTRVGGFYRDLHEGHGVRVRSRARVTGIVGADGRVTGVELAGGEVLPADVVVAGVGALPNVGLAVAAGLRTAPSGLGGGVAVDGTLATSHPDVYAAGDIASIPSPRWGRPVRVEHWATALRTGPHAAKAMLGSGADFARLPYFYSDQFDTSMEYTGFVAPDGGDHEVVFSGDVDAGAFAAFWVRGGRVDAGLSLNLPEATSAIEAIVTTSDAPDDLVDFAGRRGSAATP